MDRERARETETTHMHTTGEDHEVREEGRRQEGEGEVQAWKGGW